MLQLIADHQLFVRAVCAPLGLLFALIVAAAALNEDGGGRHERHATRRALPHERRRHRHPTETYAGTRGARAARLGGDEALTIGRPMSHVLEPADPQARRYRVANLVQHTGEISLADLETLMAREGVA